MHLRDFIKAGTIISPSNTLAVALFGAPANLVFYFLFKYIFHLPYESLSLRFIATLLCLSALLRPRLPDSLQPYFPFYWNLSMIFVLPFVFTVNLIMNNFHELWLYWEIFMVFVLIMFVQHWIMFLFDLIVGVTAAIWFCLLSPDIPPLHVTFNITLYSIVLIFTIVVGYFFSFSNMQSMKTEERRKADEKNRALQALAGSIAHEMRNPLSQIRHSLDEIMMEIPQLDSDNESVNVSNKSVETIHKRIAQAHMAVNRGTHVINMTLENFKTAEVSYENLVCLSATSVTRKAIEEYGYASEQERHMIHLRSGEDFMFLGDENNYILVLYNLIVNALHALHPIPGGRIDIYFQSGEKRNRITIRDNGPGIPQDIRYKIFDPFFTSGKKEGTGLGLAFCKRVMLSFRGDIICNSEVGQYTEFTLEFPVLDKSVISQYESKLYEAYTPFLSGKKLLLAGVPEIYLPLFRRQLAPLNIGLDEAVDGDKVLDMIGQNRYDLLLVNLNLPPADAEKLVRNLRKNGHDLPVVAFSSSIKPVIAKSRAIDTLIFMPPVLPEMLNALKTALETSRETLTKTLSGKTVLVADDLDFNRKVIKSMLNKLGVRILEASNGMEALQKLKTERCDLLIMDMRMPVLDGFETAREIRSGDTPYRNIPILGLSGNLDNETLKTAKQSGFDDSLIKPVKLKPFLQKVALMLQFDHPEA
ncbi:MAG: response regulator [Chlorobiaceae bacterium]|jgi:two-component system, CAI-1 autoinducer sensor kinase/phosphatase CqsS|nr:response regulator [Chlorobiaceae bacterium]